MCFLLIVVQETAARMGCVTGKGFAALIREQYGVRLSAFAMLALIVSNTMVTLSEFAGIASGMQLFGVPTIVSVPIAAIAVWLLGMSGSYKRIEKILLAIACVFVTYVAASFMVGPDWGQVLSSTFLPQVNMTPAYVSLLVANIGTTISPYMIFMGQGNVVEKNCDVDDLPYQRIDTVSGAIVAQLIAFFIVVCTGSVLNPAGIAVNSAEDAARALAPLAGPYAEVLKQQAAALGVAESVLFLGARPWAEIGKYYQLGDVFVSASTSETQGLTFAEAMAAGENRVTGAAQIETDNDVIRSLVDQIVSAGEWPF